MTGTNFRNNSWKYSLDEVNMAKAQDVLQWKYTYEPFILKKEYTPIKYNVYVVDQLF